jgi:hypothetical protein
MGWNLNGVELTWIKMRYEFFKFFFTIVTLLKQRVVFSRNKCQFASKAPCTDSPGDDLARLLPMFKKLVKGWLRFTDPAFSATVLLVCAIGARFSGDALVPLNAITSCLCAGWNR